MGKKEVKTNAMRILDRKKISYEYQTYECDEFTDGIETADKLNLPHEQVYQYPTTAYICGSPDHSFLPWQFLFRSKCTDFPALQKAQQSVQNIHPDSSHPNAAASCHVNPTD